MIKVVFVCHGNICRSTMAEFMFKDMMKNYDIIIDSCAISREEIGNDTHYGTKKILDKYHIPYAPRKAYLINEKIYNEYDYIICMDQNNMNNLKRLIGDNSKATLLLSYVGEQGSIADPWYSGNFELTYADIKRGLEALKTQIENTDF